MYTVESVFKDWESEGKMTIEIAHGINKNVDRLMKTKLVEIEDLIEQDKPNSAFVAMLSLTSLINAAAAKSPSIIPKLEGWVKKLISATNSLAEKLRANGFSISASFPVGVSVGLSFPITRK